MADGIEDIEKFYGDAKVYWDTISPTVDGMLGGFEKISPTDINTSKEFLRPFLKVSFSFPQTEISDVSRFRNIQIFFKSDSMCTNLNKRSYTLATYGHSPSY